MIGACARLAILLGGTVIVSGLYAAFVSNLGHSFSRASNAFWAMTLCAFLIGFVCSARPPVKRPRSWRPIILIAVVSGIAIVRSSPEGFLLFGLTPLANSWVPPLLGAASGAFIGAELSRS